MNATPFEIDDRPGDDGRRVLRALVGLGSNLGDRRDFLARALLHLKTLPRLRLVATSSLYETRAVGEITDQPDFLNACALFETTLEPLHLLKELLATEVLLGRRRDLPGGPRTIDLDLLLYEDHIERTEWLNVPHPRFHQRAFALLPAAEIAPDLEHPEFRVTLKSLADRLGPVHGLAQRRMTGSWIRTT